MAADVAADVAFFFKLGHYNGPFFSPLYFLAQTRPFIWIPKNLAHQTSTIPVHFLKLPLQPKTSHTTHAKKYIVILFTQQIEKELSFYFTRLIFL